MKKCVLLKLYFKRAFIIYPKILCITFFTFLLILAAITSVINGYNNSSEKRKLDIAIVGDSRGDYIDTGIHFLQNFDSSRFFMNFIQMSEGEAQDSLEKGKIAGYLFIPNDFGKNKNSKIKYVVSNSPVNITHAISAEVINIASEIVLEIQRGKDILSESGKGKETKKFMLKCGEFILSRHNTYELQLTGEKDSVSFPQYYMCGFFMFFLLICAVPCFKIINGMRSEPKEFLHSRGVRPEYQFFCRITTFFCVTMITLSLFAVVIGVVSSCAGGREDIFSALSFVFKMIPVIMMTTAMHIACSEIFKSEFNFVLTELIFALVMGYISGFFYPIYFFPEGIQNFSAILPSGVGFSYARNLINGTIDGASFLNSLFYSVVFITSALVFSKRNIKVERV